MTQEQYTALYGVVQVHTYQMERVMTDIEELRKGGVDRVTVEKLERDYAALMASQRKLESELRAMSEPNQTPTPAPMGFWPSLLGALSSPLTAWGKLRFTAQLLITLVALFSLTVLTDGGRELIAATLGGAANVADNVAASLRGDDAEPLEVDDVTEPSILRENRPAAASPPPAQE